MIKLPIEIGDILLVGRFKNKRIKVKEIGTDEHGLPTVNGKGILKIRIEKLMEPKKNLKEDHTNRSGKHFKNIRNLDYDVDTQDGVKIAKFIDKGKQYHYNVDKITSIRRLKLNTISIGGEYADNRKFYKEFTIQELEKILDKKLKFVNFDKEIKENMKKNLKESKIKKIEQGKDSGFARGGIGDYYNLTLDSGEIIEVSTDELMGRYKELRNRFPGLEKLNKFLQNKEWKMYESKQLKESTIDYEDEIVAPSWLRSRDVREYIRYKIGDIPGPLGPNEATSDGLNKFKQESKHFSLTQIAKKILKENKNSLGMKNKIPGISPDLNKKANELLRYDAFLASRSSGQSKDVIPAGQAAEKYFKKVGLIDKNDQIVSPDKLEDPELKILAKWFHDNIG